MTLDDRSQGRWMLQPMQQTLGHQMEQSGQTRFADSFMNLYDIHGVDWCCGCRVLICFTVVGPSR